MELNNSCLNLLKTLYAQEDYITISTLAEQIGKTERSVRYNLNIIDEFLRRKNLPFLSREFAQGIRLEHTPEVDAVLKTFLATSTPYQYKFSTAEREKFLKLGLLVGRKRYIPVGEFAERLTVCNGTVTADLVQVERWLEGKQLKLIKKSRMGLHVAGDETQILRSCIQLLNENITLAEYDRYLCNKPLDDKVTLIILNELFQGLDIDFFRELPKQAESVLNRIFSDESFGTLIFYLAVMTQRHISGTAGQIIISGRNQPLMQSDEHEAASMLLNQLSEKYQIHFSEGDNWVLTTQLLCSRSITSGQSRLGRNQVRSKRLDAVTDEIVDRIEALYHIEFGAARENLTERLKTHLVPTIYRIRYHKEIVNPLYSELVEKHSLLLRRTAEAIKPLEEYCGVPISDQEVSYIALYFLAAINEQHSQIIRRPQVIVACGSGYGTAQVVASQITRLFDVDVVDVVSGRDVSEMVENRNIQCDYIVSTVDLPRLPDHYYIKVNPIFTNQDYKRILQFIDTRKQGSATGNFIEAADQLVEVAKKHGANVSSDQLKYEFLSALIRSTQQESLDAQMHAPGLRNLLRPDLIRMDVSCGNWQEVVRASTLSMEEQGFVTEKYHKGIIRNIKDFGPAMVMFPGVLISHAAPEDGCKKLGISFLSLQQPVVFGSRENDPVRIVFTLSAVDQTSHMKALTDLFHLLSDPSIREEFFAARSRDAVLRIVQKYLV